MHTGDLSKTVEKASAVDCHMKCISTTHLLEPSFIGTIILVHSGKFCNKNGQWFNTIL